MFFSIFYFAINAGSMLATFITPALRTVSCFNQPTCYPAAFGLPALLMLVALALFCFGSSKCVRRACVYIKRVCTSNVCVQLQREGDVAGVR